MGQHHTPPTSVTLAPLSPALAALIHQVQAEAVAAATPAPLAEGAIVLPALQSAPWTYRESSKTTWLECFVGEDHAEMFVKLGVNDNGWAVELWHPAYWYQHLVRTDDQGRRWRAEGPAHVMDDFGFLVPVGGAA
ncbi:MAG: hypothetical protein AB7P37_03350 [Ramlibacter sp.]